MTKWRVYRDGARWRVEDGSGAFLFRTGREALGFVDSELRKRALARIVSDRMEVL